MPSCINLKERFGDRFRVEYEESYAADHGDNARADDPWLLQIECENGTVYPYGGNELVASTRCRGPVANRLAALDCVTLWRDGDDGVDVRFDAADAKRIFAVMKPRRKRRLSPERRAALVEAGKANRFRPDSHGVQAAGSGHDAIPSPTPVQSLALAASKSFGGKIPS